MTVVASLVVYLPSAIPRRAAAYSYSAYSTAAASFTKQRTITPHSHSHEQQKQKLKLKHHRRLSSQSISETTTTQFHEISSRLLPGIHPLQLFRIVQDVDRYQDFLPFCGHSAVVPDTIRSGGRFFEAELSVGFGPSLFGSSLSSSLLLFQTKYLSKVSIDPENLTIETKSGTPTTTTKTNKIEGNGRMFDSLTSSWKLRPVVVGGDDDSSASSGTSSTITSDRTSSDRSFDRIGTSVDFKVEMTVSDPMVEAVLNQVLVNVAETQVQAFHDRCRALPKPTNDELLTAERFYQTNNIKKITTTATQSKQQ